MSSPLLLIVAVLLGIGVGALIVWWLGKQKEQAMQDRFNDREQLLETESKERVLLQTKVNELMPLEGRLAGVDAQNAERSAKLIANELEFENLRSQISDAAIQQESVLANAAAQLESIKRERERFIDEKKHLEDSFAKLSQEALDQAQISFIKMANEKFKDARELNQEQMDKILTPVKESLGQLAAHSQEIEKNRTESYAELTSKVRELATSTTQLSNALRRPEVRGSWGEHTMRQTAERAGLVEGTDFRLQVTVRTEGGDLRPDMIVNMPNDRKIIVDSKAPFSAYMDAIDLEDGDAKRELLSKHAKQLKGHVKMLTQKEYQRQFDSPEMVVMFVPAESLYLTALQEDPNLVSDAMDRGVVIASPMTLFALLRMLAEGARQVKAMEEIKQIVEIGSELHDSISTFLGHYVRMGRNLASASAAYNDGMGSLERNVLSKARKMKEHGLKSSKAIDEVELLEVSIRPSLTNGEIGPITQAVTALPAAVPEALDLSGKEPSMQSDSGPGGDTAPRGPESLF